jgi:predicted Rossmann fold nucleotide-binding protein DprA/Smf involved in DNA uptake
MTALLAVTLRSHLIAEPPPLSNKVWDRLREVIPEAALSASPVELLLDCAHRLLEPGEAEQVEARLGALSAVEDALAELQMLGICALSEFDDDYPRRFHATLGSKKPPLLFFAGHPELLNRPSIGIVGSREADHAAQAFARSVAEAAVEEGYAVVSGGAKGIDQVSMKAAYDAGGDSIGFLAESLVRRAAKEPEVIEGGSVCLATPYSPDAPFSVGNAMGRNKLIYGHAVATVVVSAASGSGGTWAGAVEAIRLNLPVVVRCGPGAPDGNKELLKETRGGLFAQNPRPLADSAELWELVQELHTQSPGT